MAHWTRKRRALVAGVLVTIAACSGVPGSSAPSATPTGTVFVTLPPTPTPSPTPTSGVVDFHYGKLEAGTYRSVVFTSPLTFIVEGGMSGWSGGFDSPTILELHAQRNAADTLIFGLPNGFFHRDLGLFESLAVDATLSDEVAVRIDGLAGASVEFVAPQLEDRPNYAADDDYPIFFGRGTEMLEQEGNYFAKAGDHIRATQIYRGDDLLVILVVAKSAAEYAIVVDMADKLLETIEID